MGQGTLKFLGGGLSWKYPSFLPGFDVKESRSCFDGVVGCAVFNIHAADRERSGAEGRFLVKQKANLRLRQFSPRLFLLQKK